MNPKEVRVAFLGVSHWHVPLYFPALEQGQVVAVSDPASAGLRSLPRSWAARPIPTGANYWTSRSRTSCSRLPGTVT